MAMNPILLRTERHASWYSSIQTKSETSSKKMRDVSLKPDYNLPWCWLSQFMKRNLTPTWEPTSCEVWVNASACRMVSDGTKRVGILRRISLPQELPHSSLIFRRRWSYGPPNFGINSYFIPLVLGWQYCSLSAAAFSHDCHVVIWWHANRWNAMSPSIAYTNANSIGLRVVVAF